MWNLISGLKTLRENSGQIFLLAIWSLDVLKRIVKIFPKRLLNKEIKKAGLKFNPGLGLIGLWTTGAWCLFLNFLRWKKMFCKKVVLRGTTRPLMLSNSVWSLLLSLGPKNHNNLTFVWICYCLLAGQGLSSSEDDDIAWKQLKTKRKSEEEEERKKHYRLR